MKHDSNIEMVSIEDIMNELQKLDIIKQYKEGKYIDVLKDELWHVGYIIKENEKVFSIHFEGQSRDNDLILIKEGLNIIAPFRIYTQGYTGPSDRARRFFKYSQTYKKEIESKLMSLIDSKFSVNDPIEFTQFFRGELFFYIDSLITSLPKSITKDNIKEILEFLKR